MPTKPKRALLAVVLALFTSGLLAPPASAQLFGESREEKAAREQRERDQEAAISQLSQRVRDLEDTLRQITGNNEELSFRLRQSNERVDRMQRDFEYRICTLTAQQMDTDPEAMNCGMQQSSAGYSVAPPAGAMAPSGTPPSNAPLTLPPPPGGAPSGGQDLAPAPGVLGTLSARQAATIGSGGGGFEGSGVAPSADRSAYDTALGQMGKAQFAEARAGFRTFADTHPQDPLAPQALYWVGVIAHTQKDYAAAARAFAEGIKKYPDSTRAPETMLKLGESLIALGQKTEGCTTLAALPSKYKDASKGLLSQASAARKAAGCR